MTAEIAVRREVEIGVRVRNEPNALARLFATVTSSGTEILASSEYSTGKWAAVLLVVEHLARVERLLAEGGFEYATHNVILVSAPEGVMSGVLLSAQVRKAGIGILHSYTSWLEPDVVCAVFKTVDDERALEVLQHCFADTFEPGVEDSFTVPVHRGSSSLAFRE